MDSNQATVDDLEFNECRVRVVGILDDLGDALEAITRQRLRTSAGTIQSVPENSWSALKETGKFLNGPARLSFIRSFKVDRCPRIVE
jgi:hypothetical protein